jgi:hypothetical protein
MALWSAASHRRCGAELLPSFPFIKPEGGSFAAALQGLRLQYIQNTALHAFRDRNELNLVQASIL